jgi:ankyrin repeat protein
MCAALSSTPPAWREITVLVQEHDAAVLDVRSYRPVCEPRLRFAYERPAALHLAALYGKLELAALLLARGADVNARAGGLPRCTRRCRECGVQCAPGRTPLFAAVDAWATGGGGKAMVDLLLGRSADAGELDDMRNSAMTVAVLKGNVDAIGVLAGHAAKLMHTATAAGWVALHEAAWNGDMAAVQALVRLGAAVGSVTGDGKTAADLAREGRFTHVAKYLTCLAQ